VAVFTALRTSSFLLQFSSVAASQPNSPEYLLRPREGCEVIRSARLSACPLVYLTSSSAIAEGPRDALSQLKSRQLLHNCSNNHI